MKYIKSLLFLFVSFVMLLASCSSDDSVSENVGPVFVMKSVTETIYYGGESEVSTTNFIYENNILTGLTNGNIEADFIYDGEKILRVDYFNNGSLVTKTSIFYNGSQMDYTLSGINQDERTEYTYSNGKLASLKSGHIENGELVVLSTENYIFDADSNISTLNSIIDFGNEIFSSRREFTYDAKNNPMKFMNKYYRLVYSNEGFRGVNSNNAITQNAFSPSTSANPTILSYEITYNDADFPVEIKKKDANNNLISTTVIEYLQQ